MARRLFTDAASARRRRRWWASGGVVVLMIAFQFTFDRKPGSISLPVFFVGASAVIINGSLSVYERLIQRLNLRTLRIAVGGMLISVVLGALLGAVLYLVVQHVEVVRERIVMPNDQLQASPWRGVMMGIFIAGFQAGIWFLVFFIPAMADSDRIRSLELANLRLEATEVRTAAELAKLRTQLEPHFLLNTLNLISGLVTIDPAKARRLIGCLGDLLRDALHDAGDMHTLGEELAWLRRYVEILESRHGDLLRVRWEIQEEIQAAVIPRLLLQPLVENALKHGVLRQRGGGEILIRAEKRGGEAGSRLVYEVADTGPGIGSNKPRDGGVGVENVRRRIQLACPDGTFQLMSTESGTRAVIDLPFSITPPAPVTYGELP